MQPVSHPRVFSAAWFARHQRALLTLLRTPVIGRELREALAIRRHDVGWDGRIVRLTPPLQRSNLAGFYADNGGSANDPKLVITYSGPSFLLVKN